MVPLHVLSVEHSKYIYLPTIDDTVYASILGCKTLMPIIYVIHNTYKYGKYLLSLLYMTTVVLLGRDNINIPFWKH